MAVVDRFSTSPRARVRVRVAHTNVLGRLEQEINRVLEEEHPNGADVVDIKYGSTPPQAGASHGEYVALILLRGGRPDQ
jgi:hypothetical protein